MPPSMPCPQCGFTASSAELQCSRCGALLPAAVQGNPTNPNAYVAPDPRYQAQPFQSTNMAGDATGGVIPYKNPKALIAYYLGLFSGLPLIGFPLGVIAFVLGILGLIARNRNPAIKGSVHAAIGIGCGGVFAILWGFVIVAMIFAAVAR